MKCAATSVGIILASLAGLFFLTAQSPSAAPSLELAALQAEVERLRGMVPDQAHAMADVGSHFSNLWSAGKEGNWPLAEFFAGETRSHLKWAVRVIPVRKTPEGKDLPLGPIADAWETGPFVQLQAAIKAKDPAAFGIAYDATLASCYGCHVSSGKPYLRLHRPERPEATMIDFHPAN